MVEKTNRRNEKLLWRFKKADAWGNTKQYQLGNGHTTDQDYNLYTGNLSAIQTGSANQIQNLSYNFDKYGDLEYRWDHLNNIKEEFDYDNLHRLTGVELINYSGRVHTEVRYDELGNIIFKTGVGTYHYETNRPHAVSRISGGDLAGSFNYDANGNMTQGGGRDEIRYNTVDKPTLIRAGSTKTEFQYGFDGVRFKRTDHDGSSRKDTYYIGNVEFTQTNGMTTLVQRHLAGVAVELDYYGSNKRQEFNYLYRDHLGSVTVMTDVNGNVVSEYSYDVWGQRRPLDTGVAHPLKQLNRAMQFAHTDYNRGFTGHEHVDKLGIIHMNGRVYDPRLARFLSVEPYVADGTSLQAYNRYSYVRNNPLNATDPSGYYIYEIVAAVLAAIGVSEAVIAVLEVVYAIYLAYTAVDTVYNTVQAFKYGNGGLGNIVSSVLAVYGAYNAFSNLNNTATSNQKGAEAEGSNNASPDGTNSKSTDQLNLENKNQTFADNNNVVAYEKDGIRKVKVKLKVNTKQHRNFAKSANEAYNTEVYTDIDGTQYQAEAEITKASAIDAAYGDYDINIQRCDYCNTKDVYNPYTKLEPNVPLAAGDHPGNIIYLPDSKMAYFPSTPAHEVGHNIGLSDCNSCSSIMQKGSLQRLNKLTLEDVKTIYNGYKN